MSKLNKFCEDIHSYLMAKLPDIDKAAAIEISEYMGWRISRYIQDVLDERVIDAPTVDAVGVVRCKNCKHWHHSGYCKLIGMKFDWGGNDYCSFGERKGYGSTQN